MLTLSRRIAELVPDISVYGAVVVGQRKRAMGVAACFSIIAFSQRRGAKDAT